MRLILAGDLILSRSLSGDADPLLPAVVTRVREADLAIANLECVFAGPNDPPAQAACGPWLGAEPALASELPWLGLGAVSRANNHAGDFGAAGMATTSAALERHGISHAGVGTDLQQARSATCIETGQGRVALVSAASTFTLASMAVAGRPDVPGTPGVSPLRVRDIMTVPPEQLSMLQDLVSRVGQSRVALGPLQFGEHLARLGGPAPDLFSPGMLGAFGTTFEAGPGVGLRRELAELDRTEVLAAVRAAAEVADVVVLALHCHESGSRPGTPDPFQVRLAHDAVAAGARVVVGHGPHHVRGIEAYRGGLILYGLGSLAFQYDGFQRQPAPAYEAVGLDRDADPHQWLERKWAGGRRGAPAGAGAWESVLAEVEFAGSEPVAARVIPIRHERTGPHLGNPRLAGDEVAGRVIAGIAAASQALGTVVDRDGRVRVDQVPRAQPAAG